MAKKSPSIPPSAAPESAPRHVEATPVEELLAQAEGPGDRAEEFMRSHWRTIVIATVGALLIVAIVIVTRGYQQHRANLAAQAFTSAASIDEFEAVVRSYPGTIAAGNSLLRKAALLWEQGETQLSTDTLEQFLREFENHPLRPQTLISLGSRLEELERASAAEVHYRTVIEKFADTPYAPMAQLRLAEIELAGGNIESGRSLLERMPSTFPLYGPTFVGLAEERIEQLDAGLPTSPIPPPADAPVAPAPTIPGLDLGSLPEFMPDGLELVPGLTPDVPGLDQSLPGADLPPLGEDLPALPDLPEIPDLPETPAMPAVPAPADQAEAPEAPETPTAPDAPATPDTPATPDAPATPEAPALPEPPATPEPPAAPETPTDPEEPQVPALPAESDSAETPAPSEDAPEQDSDTPEPSEDQAAPSVSDDGEPAESSESAEEAS